MKLLVVSATKLEIAPSLAYLKRAATPVVISGVGAAPSVYAIARAIQQYQPQMVIQAGIAGCFDRNISLGALLVVAKDQFGDLGVQEQGQWHSIFEMGFANPSKKPFKDGFLENPYKNKIRMVGLPAVQGVTVNEVSTNKSRIRLLTEKGFVTESMEGAALHYVALMEKVPFLQIRSISNYVGERHKGKWQIQKAIESLNTELQQLVSNILIKEA